MAHNQFAKTTPTAGDWSGVTWVDWAWMTTLDRNAQQSINGDLGGVWAPASQIVIGGSGLSVNLFTGTICELEDVTIDGSLTIDGGAMLLRGSSSMTFADSGTAATWQTGTSANFQTGSTLSLSNGATLSTGASATVSHLGPVLVTGTLTLGSTINRVVAGISQLMRFADHNTDWFRDTVGWMQVNAVGASELIVPLEVPNAATLTAVTVRWDPVSSHAGMPAQMPVLTIYKFNPSTGATTALGFTTDPTTVLGSYEAPHSWAVTGLSEVIDHSTNYYFALFFGEDSTNALPNGHVRSVAATFTTASYDVGAA